MSDIDFYALLYPIGSDIPLEQHESTLYLDAERGAQCLTLHFGVVVAEPSTPPPRQHNHQIPLFSGTTPISVRPYEYKFI